MDYEAAKRVLLRHAGYLEPAQGNPPGFLDMLRPYRGLVESNFHVIMEALFVIGARVHVAASVERDLVHVPWDLCLTARMWGLEPDGMLQRNKLISPEDTRRLRAQVWTIELTALGFLRGLPPCRQVERYAQYILDFGPSDNAEFFVPLMCEYLADEEEMEPVTVVQSLGRLGKRAVPAIPELRRAAQRQYTCYIPHDRCTEEIRGEIEIAIAQIEAAV